MRHSNLRTLTVLALMFSASVCSIAQKRYRVDGFTNGYEGRVLYMSYTDGRGRDIVDSCKVSNGTFRFEGTLDIDNALASSLPTRRLLMATSTSRPNSISSLAP